MKDESILSLLEETAERLSIKLTYDDLRKGEVNTHGGAYLLRGEKHFLIHKNLDVKEKVEILTDLLAHAETEDTHLAPELRERFERARSGLEKTG